MQHTKSELEVISNYEAAIDRDILDYVQKICRGECVMPITVGFLNKKATEDMVRLTGKTVSGNRVVLDENAVRHILNRHGDAGVQDTSMKNVEDIARIGYVLAEYDEMLFYHEYAQGYVDAEGKAAPKVVIKKRIDGTYYVIEAVSDAKKHRNYIITAYIVPRNKENDPSVPNNAEALGLRPKRS